MTSPYSDIPILILSAKSQDNDKILGLNLGADDYIGKPFNPVEIVARVKAQLRRAARAGGDTLQVGDLTLNTATFQLTKGDRANAVAAAFLLFAFMSSACALLAYGVVAHKSSQNYELLNNSPFYLGGFAQGFETLLALVLMCLLPWWFLPIAIIFGVLGLVKALTIVIAAYYNFVIANKKSGTTDINE